MASDGLPDGMGALPHSARVRRAVELGRRARTDPGAARTLRQWRAGGFTLRLLAVHACHGSRDAAALAALSADPSRTISQFALAAMGHVGDDDALVAALEALPPRRVARVLLRLRRKREAAVDRYIAARANAGNAAAWPLVPLGSPALFDRHLAAAAGRGDGDFWHRLSVLHPARAAAELVARLDATTEPDGALFRYAESAILHLSDRLPDTALALVTALGRHARPSSGALTALALRRPIAVADLVLASTDGTGAAFERVAHRLGVARIVALFRRDTHALGDPERWLARLPADDRATVYAQLSAAWTASNGTVPLHYLARLPAALRAAEARRMVALPALAARPLQRLPYAGLLPSDEAREQAKSWLGHPEAENRAAALAALCEAARFDRVRLGDLLELLAARKHEQDPVRMAFLGALAALPPGRWRAEHLPGLAQVVRDALDAADLSPWSAAAVGRLLFALLPFHPGWAADRLADVTRERGFPSGGPGRPLTPDDIRRIAPVLTPILRTWRDREHESALLALASCVGRQLPLWPELVAVLEGAVRTASAAAAATAAACMAILVEHLPAERERIVTGALARDESWVLQPPVMNTLHARRQDLLSPFLGQRAYAGLFSTGKVRHVLPLSTGFHRWTDAQQETFSDTLAELARPPASRKDAQLSWDVLQAVRRLPALPAVGPERLVALARDGRPAVREAAVRALGRLDARQGLPELTEALADDRARWAVYALRAALADLPPARVLEAMRAVPLGKVTVAKEAVRLAGEFGGEAAVGWFVELDRQPLHRDVRGALLRALWDHLDRPEAWAILDASALSLDPGVVIGLARMPLDRASAEARGKGVNLMRVLLGHPEPTVRVAVLERLALQPVPDPARVLLAEALERMGSPIPDEREAALRAALAAAADGDAPRFAAAFARLLPRRRELAAAAGSFADETRSLGHRLVAVRSAVLAAVESDPAAVGLQIGLAAARLAAEPFAAWVLRLAGTDRWHAGTQLAAAAAATGSGQPAEDLERVEAAWAAAGDPAARRLALRLLIHVAAVQGWTAERRRRLEAYRCDPSPAVADEAAFTFPPED